MKRTLIRYKTTPESAEENQRLVEKVFQELHGETPGGIRYMSLRLDDDTFVHFVEAMDDSPSLTRLPAFKSFQTGIEERCIEPPQFGEATIVGNYRMLDEG